MRTVFILILEAIMIIAMNGYEDSLVPLVEKTTRNAEAYVKNEAAHHITTIAQRVNTSPRAA